MYVIKKGLVHFLFVSFFVIPIIINAQIKSNTNIQKKKFSSGLIIKKDRQSYQGTNLIFDSQSLIFKDKKTLLLVTIPLEEIQYVKAKTGTYSFQGALLLGGLFLLSALSAIADIESDPYTEVENPSKVIMVMTSIGFGGGLIIGSLFPKEKIVCKRGRLL